jgi:hypothetical protein
MKKTTDQKYALMWKDRVGFARAAIRNRCIVIPISNIGTEDMLDVVYDIPLSSVPIPFLFGSDRTFPVVKPNSLQKLYFKCGVPVDTAMYNCDTSDANCGELRDTVKAAIEGGIEDLKQYRALDKNRGGAGGEVKKVSTYW